MEYYCGIQMSSGDYICHHGVKGQKWGRRRYQNEDGSLINGGNKRNTQLGIKRKGNYAFRDHNGNFHLVNKEENKTIRKNLRRGKGKALGAAVLAGTGMTLSMTAVSAKSYRQMGIRTAAGLLSSIGAFALSRSARKNARNIQKVQENVMKRHHVKTRKYKIYR